MRIALSAATSVLCLVHPAVAQQRPLHDVTPNSVASTDAILSPSGQHIVFRENTRLVVIGRDGANPVSVHIGTAAGGFLWAPSSGSIFVVEGSRVLSTPRTSATPTQLRDFPGQSVFLWDVDSTGSVLLLSRFDAATATYTAFLLPAAGGSPIDLRSSQDEIYGLRLDPSDSFVLALERATAPFSPVAVKRIELSTSNVIDFLPGVVSTLIEDVDWIDGGTEILATAQVPGDGVQIVRYSLGSATAVPLTGTITHRLAVAAPVANVALCQSIDGVGGNGPALVDLMGGGEILLHTGEQFLWAGKPSIDLAGTTVVFSAQRVSHTENPRVFRLDLDREMSSAPRAARGQNLDLTLPLSSTEIGAIFLGQRQFPFTLSGITYNFDLGGNFALLTVGAPTNFALTFTIPLPADPVFRALRIDYQGFRFNTVGAVAEFTRSGRFVIF
jgi:hypothetical protein